MSSIGDVIDEASTMLHGYTGIRERMTYLTSTIDALTTTIPVSNSTRITQGLIEIDDELMLVDTVDEGQAELFPDGRAELGTTAQGHSAMARVTNDPFFPRIVLLRAARDTVSEIHPDLYQVKAFTFTFSPAKLTYELPADVDRILEVKFDIPGPTGIWPLARAWTYDPAANVTEYPSGKTVMIDEWITPGKTVQVTYAAPFGSINTSMDTFSDLGIPESARDVLVYGVAWRLTQSMEVSRLQLQAVEQFARQDAVGAGANTNLAKQWFAMYSAFRERERKRLLALHPMQIHYKGM